MTSARYPHLSVWLVVALCSWGPFCKFHTLMDKNLPPIGPRAVVDQALETSLSGRGVALKAGAHPHYEPSSKQKKISRSDVVSKNPASEIDSLMQTDVFASLSYGTIHSIFKSFGVDLWIRLTYDSDCQSIRCYITFNISADA